MRRGFVAFLVLLAFAPLALQALDIHKTELEGIHATKQFMLEQQAITVKEQDFEESFWRVVKYAKPQGENAVKQALRNWAENLPANTKAWYGYAGDLSNITEGEFIPAVHVAPRFVVVVGEERWAIGATIKSGGSKGYYIIPKGVSHEYS